MKQKQLPFWLVIVGLSVVVLSHTQLTIRQIALRLTGVREGEVAETVALDRYLTKDDRFDRRMVRMPRNVNPNELGILFDPHATYIPGELAGDSLFFKWGALTVLDNTARHLLVRCESIFELNESINESNNYHTGAPQEGLLARTARSLPRIHVTPGDVALLAFACGMIIFLIRSRARVELGHAFWPTALFLAICGLSLVQRFRPFDTSLFTPDLRRGVVEWIQFVELFVVAWASFATLLRVQSRREIFFRVICIMTGIVCIIGLTEYWAVFSGRSLRGLLDVEAIDGPFGIRFNAPRAWTPGSESNRNVLALYLAITFPFLVAAIRSASTVLRKGVALVTAMIAASLILHVMTLLIAFIGGMWVCVTASRRWTLGYVTLFTLTLVGVCVINPTHGKVLLDSVAMHRTKDLYGLQPMPSKGGTFDGDSAWQQKYVERQAAFNAIGHSPLLGIGLGNYQNAINDFYSNVKVEGHDLEKVPSNLMERHSHAAAIVLSVETGVLGLIALMVCLGLCIRRSMVVENTLTDPRTQAIQSAISASTLVLAISIFHTSFLIRGINLIAAAILAATGVTTEETCEEPEAPETAETSR